MPQRFCLVLVALGVFGGAAPANGDEARPFCAGDYADELTVLSPRVRELERDPGNQYSYCLRTTATYECLSYAADGSVRRARRSVVAHGTAFAYKRAGGETFLVTNDHVASWPAVTDEEHKIDEVPAGCKMVSEWTKIVDDEGDGYDANDVALTRVAADPALDIAILKTREPLKQIPWRMGRSASLHVGNVVAVHGFPLGAFPATNIGKVVNTADRDTARDWDHVDFVVDALLSPGNSGSPVLAVSCKTGEYELVGVYHAGYVNGSALNVVVGIDELRDFMTTMKRVPRVAEAIGPGEREQLRAAAAAAPFFPLGSLTASVRPAGEALWFEVYSRGFPLHDERVLVIEDLPKAGVFGQVGRVWVGNRRGLRAFVAGADADAQAHLARIVTRLRTNAVTAMRWRSVDPATHAGERRLRSLERDRDRHAPLDRDAAQLVLDMAERLGPRPGDPVVSYAAATAPKPSPAPPPSRVATTRRPR